MPVLLDQLTARGINWGIVTNKPAFLTDPLIEQLGLSEDAVCVVSGDTTANRKPHRNPCCTPANSPAANRKNACTWAMPRADIEAGNAAGMQTLVALFGYIGAQEHPETGVRTA